MRRSAILSVLVLLGTEAGEARDAQEKSGRTDAPARPEVTPIPLAKLPANRWTVLYAEKAPTHTPARMAWVPEKQAGLVCDPSWRPRSLLGNDPFAPVQLFSPEKGAWEPYRAGIEGGRLLWEVTGHCYTYLSGLKRVLMAHPPMPVPREKRDTPEAKILGFLLDPQKNLFSPIHSDLSMSDAPADFGELESRGTYQKANVGPFRGIGEAVPRMPWWGSAVYDAHNREAVLVGGGGPFGRVGKEKERVKPGDWIFDEARGRIRRVTPGDQGTITEARRWFPGHCGTWLFSEETQSWRALEQPLGRQPSGRILPAVGYDHAQKKIVLFGGDDHTRCLGDTWVYDCTTRTWSEVHPQVSPPPRACAGMTGIPGPAGVLLAGGYGTGWQERSDVWVYQAADNSWTRLPFDLPEPAAYASADADPKTGAVMVCGSNATLVSETFSFGYSTRCTVSAMKLDLETAPAIKASGPSGPELAYHCQNPIHFTMPPPEDFLGPKNPGLNPEAGRKALAGLPANTWVKRKTPLEVVGRQWGSYAYDLKSHRVLAWGGGHFGHIGNEIHESDVIANRWRAQVDPVSYCPRWQHGAGDFMTMSFQGWRLMGTHASQSYGMDAVSNSLITLLGDVYSLKHHMIVDHIGRSPEAFHDGGRHPLFVSTPHGLYRYRNSATSQGPLVERANVAKRTWETVAKGNGPGAYNEHNHACYDSTRDRIVYFHAVKGKWAAPANKDPNPTVWTFDFKTGQWAAEKPAGPEHLRPMGGSTYIPELDAACMVHGTPDDPKAPERMYFYKLGERKWYTAPYAGDATWPNWTGRDFSLFYDPDLGIVVRATHGSRAQGMIDILVMRLDPKTIKLAPFQSAEKRDPS